MHRHDGSDSARARSARIRADHDYEATRLDSMRRRSSTNEECMERAGWWRACAATLARLTGRRVAYRAGEDASAAEAAEATAGVR
jgi:hypothetical protein